MTLITRARRVGICFVLWRSAFKLKMLRIAPSEIQFNHSVRRGALDTRVPLVADVLTEPHSLLIHGKGLLPPKSYGSRLKNNWEVICHAYYDQYHLLPLTLTLSPAA